jgi:hypothetical protein
VDGVDYVFRTFADPPAAIFMEAVDAGTGEPIDLQPLPVYAYWFAWHAVDPAVAIGAAEDEAGAADERIENDETARERERRESAERAGADP